MACFGRTAQPGVGQGTTSFNLGALGAALLVLFLAANVTAQTAPAGSTPAGAEIATPPESKPPTETAPASAATAANAPAARAAGHALENIVTVTPGATCLDRERLIDRVARWLQRTRIEAPLRVVVRGDNDLATRVFFSVVRTPGDSAERRLDNAPSDCDQMHSAVALSIALAIEATLEHPLTAAGDIPAPAAKPPAWQRPAPAPRVHLELAMLAGASVGAVTNPALAAGPRLSISPASWLEITIVGFATHLAGDTFGQVAGSFDETIIAGGLDACFGGETSQGVGFFMCAGARGGAFRVAGMDFNSGSRSSTSQWWALAGSGQGRFWLTEAFGFGTGVEALYTLAARDLKVAGVDASSPSRIRHVSQVGLSVTLGPVFRFF